MLVNSSISKRVSNSYFIFYLSTWAESCAGSIRFVLKFQLFLLGKENRTNSLGCYSKNI